MHPVEVAIGPAEVSISAEVPVFGAPCLDCLGSGLGLGFRV